MKQFKLVTFTFIFIVLGKLTFAQNLVFTDSGFKIYLLYTDCIDTNGDGIADSSVDFNSDGEIQSTEANLVQWLTFTNANQTSDTIYNIQDLNYFVNLKKLYINGSYMIRITDIIGLNLDSLKFLNINGLELNTIDLSDINNLDSLYIHSVTGRNGASSGLNYLNLKNGNYPSGAFSLFYTENIVNACIDSVYAEYNEVAQHMLPWNIPSFTCQNVGIKENSINKQRVTLYPNPAKDRFSILEGEDKIKSIKIVDCIGNVLLEQEEILGSINISNLVGGIYFVIIKTVTSVLTEKIVIE